MTSADEELPIDPRIELAPGIRVPGETLRFRFVRARGPGGQNVNKVSTACELRVSLADLSAVMSTAAIARLRIALGSRLTAAGEIQLVSDEHRSQEQNRDEVLGRLRELLIHSAKDPKPRKKTKPSKRAQRRRLESKRHRSAIKGGRRSRFEE